MRNYSWFEVYRVALLELDRNKIPERLAFARQKTQSTDVDGGFDR